jgi:aldehyde:ferredoxin oxidoreductase
MALARDLSQRSLGPATAKYRELGTAANVMAFNRIAALPTRNFQTSCWDAADALSPEELSLDRSRTRSACASCTIGCEHRYPLRGGNGASARIEYESLFALGPLCGVADPDAVIELSQRCDTLGLDTVSAGGTLAFAMECGERGYLEGAPRFGEVGAMLAILDDIAQRRGLGARLAEGSRHLAVEIGRDALDFAPQVKGLELPGYEPRALQTMALGFAVGTRGADHNRSGAYEVDFSTDVERTHGSDHGARRAVETENRAALTDSLILCKFLRGVFDDFYGESAELLEAVTGWDFDAEELQAVARRIVGLRKALNIREGWSPTLDTLPERFFREPLQEGASAGARLPRERLAGMILAYHRERGWSDDGYLLDPERHDLARDTALGEPGVPG